MDTTLTEREDADRRKDPSVDVATYHGEHASNEKLANPLVGYLAEDLKQQGAQFARLNNMNNAEDVRAFEIGAVLVQDAAAYRLVEGITEEEKAVLTSEITSRWSQPKMLYLVIVMRSTCAALQGMDETVVNGAQLFYLPQFGIDQSAWLTGLVNSAPYLCCAMLSCWLSVPMNNWWGRRGTIFVTCAWSAVACLWQALTDSWWHMLIARFALGLGIGPISATVPIYASECSPPLIRGAMTMQWQMWTAFGIMLGFAADLVFFRVSDIAHINGLNWRLMMGAPMLPAIVVCFSVCFCPESPRWYMSKNRHQKAYSALCRLRFNKIQAARDIFYMQTLLKAEKAIQQESNWRTKVKALELVHVPRNRRSMLASEIVMFMQQFCGVNVIAYYSSIISREGGFSETNALVASLGFGAINFLFVIPAVYTIDSFGRRNLLLVTLPLLSLCLFLTGFAFWIPETSQAHVALIAVGIYLFGVVYSPGAGPVPFTYSTEAYPLSVRSYGMSLATATTWFFNFLLSITWPSLLKAFKPQGAFAYYAIRNLIGWFAVLLFVPETKGLSLEELDQVFNVLTRKHAKYGLQQARYFVERFILRQSVRPAVLSGVLGEKDRDSESL